MGFEVENLEAFTRDLSDRGVDFDVEYRVIEGVDIGVAFFTDDSGTFWELTQGLSDLAGS